MVEKITINPEEIRAYGNISEDHDLNSFRIHESSLSNVKDTVNGVLSNVYKLMYSLYGIMFDFDKGNKQLYLQMEEADTLTFGFDDESKQLYLVDEDDTGFNLGFDPDTRELYITDEAPPIISISASSPYLVSGETTDLVVSLVNEFGSPVSGKTVTISDGTSLYSGITNNQGIFTVYDISVSSNSTFTATYGTETATTNVYLCQFVDYGTSTKHNDDWSTWGSYSVTRTRSVESTLIEPVDRTTASYQIKYISNMSSPSIIEFDCCQVGGATNSIIFQLRGNNQSVIRQIALSSYTNLSLGEWYHWKVDLVNGNFTNETTNQTLTFSTGSIISFFFSIPANAQHNFKYKNFVIY